MSYPVFSSRYSGRIIDLKDGVYEKSGNRSLRKREGVEIRLINFCGINSHPDTGMTGALKNFMGITDLSCGSWGLHPDGYYNVHHCGESHYTHAKAGPMCHFIKTIRAPDLNIATCEWVGWGHRTDPGKAAHAKTVVASRNPLFLDYY